MRGGSEGTLLNPIWSLLRVVNILDSVSLLLLELDNHKLAMALTLLSSACGASARQLFLGKLRIPLHVLFGEYIICRLCSTWHHMCTLAKSNKTWNSAKWKKSYIAHQTFFLVLHIWRRIVMATTPEYTYSRYLKKDPSLQIISVLWYGCAHDRTWTASARHTLHHSFQFSFLLLF